LPDGKAKLSPIGDGAVAALNLYFLSIPLKCMGFDLLARSLRRDW